MGPTKIRDSTSGIFIGFPAKISRNSSQDAEPRLPAQMVAAAHDDGARVAIHVRGGARAPTALAAGGDARVDGGARRVLAERAGRLHVYY